MAKRKRWRTPYDLYYDAVAWYKRPGWNRPMLISKRLRMVIRLIALEERCQQFDVGALPPRMMEQLRLLSDFKEAHGHNRYRKIRFYRPAGANGRKTRNQDYQRLRDAAIEGAKALQAEQELQAEQQAKAGLIKDLNESD